MNLNIIKANKILLQLKLLDIDIYNIYAEKLRKQDKFIEQSELNKYDDEGNLINKTPEYVKYIKGEDIGKIVKVIKWTSHSYCCVEFSDGTYKEPFKHLVEPSTKSAYDVQFKKDRDEEFKVGDWIVVKDTSTILGNNNIKIYYPGLVAQISSLHFHEQRWNTNGNPYWYWLELNGFPLDKNNAVVGTNLRKALPHEIPTNVSKVSLYPETPEACYKKEELILLVETDEELPMVQPKPEIRLNKFLSIEE